jgi:hypothetical protein
MPIVENSSQLKQLMQECEPNWTALRKAVEDEERSIAENWGDKELPLVEKPQRPADVIRKHEEQKTGINLTDKGTASTTKKIVQSAISSRMKLQALDDALK